MKYIVKNIDYDIEIEDVSDMFSENDFALRSDFIAECEKKIKEINETLPTEMVLDINIDTNDIANTIMTLLTMKFQMLYRIRQVGLLKDLNGRNINERF